MNNVEFPNLKRQTSHKRRSAYLTVIIILAGLTAAFACSWSLWTDHSVRFNGMRSGRGFYRLPPLPIMYDPKTGKELTVAQINEELYNEGESDVNENAAETTSVRPDPDEVWNKARAAAEDGDLGRSKILLDQYLQLTNAAPVDEDSDQQSRRNSAYDILDAMTAEKQGSEKSSVKQYVLARYAMLDNFDVDLKELARKSAYDKNLSDNWAYLVAAQSYVRDKDSTLDAFHKILVRFPNSEKRESALYMTARLTMELSHSFGNEACGVVGKTYEYDQIDPDKIEPVEQCRDTDWRAAVAEFKRLMSAYPNGRYHNDARGWLAYLYRRGGMRAEALAEYYRLLGNPKDRYWRLEAKKSLQMIGQDYDDPTLDKVEQMIANEPDTAMAYAYHRIYNQAVDLTDEKVEPWMFSSSTPYEEQESEKKKVADANASGRHELERVSSFASSMIKRYPNAHISGGFVLRIAEAQFELGKNADAIIISKKALGMGVQGDLRAQALWIKGCVEHLDKDFKQARKTFAQLVQEFPDSNLTEGARRLIAMTAEDQDDLETALEQYLDLNYDQDVAYFVDVLMDADRLAKFVSTHENLPQHDYLLYALAVRYMRDNRWNEARETLHRIKAEPGNSVDDVSDEQTISFAKEPMWNDKEHIIKTSWVTQDLKTIDELKHLESAVQSADGDEAKAEAMYQLASYQFDSSSLLFYNPAAWQGQRYWLLSGLASDDHMRLANESQNLFEYFEKHDHLARAIPIYLDIVDKYPNTKAAKDALYSAAVAHERLSESNPYWREIYGRGLFAGPKMVTYQDVKRVYPNYQLPRGSYGWEASTRTVNGGPGWAPKPTPLPKVSREEKAKRKLKEYFEEYSPMVKAKVTSTAETSYQWLCTYLYLVFGSLILLISWKVWKSRM